MRYLVFEYSVGTRSCHAGCAGSLAKGCGPDCAKVRFPAIREKLESQVRSRAPISLGACLVVQVLDCEIELLALVLCVVYSYRASVCNLPHQCGGLCAAYRTQSTTR